MRIPRPYGGEIVLEAPDVPTIGEYLDRTRDWFTKQPEELDLFEETVVDCGMRELAQFSAIVNAEWPAPPASVEMRYEPAKRQKSLPPPVVGDDYAAVASIERRGVSCRSHIGLPMVWTIVRSEAFPRKRSRSWELR